ncbi:MAG: CDP-glycerol glycerophosphotransferase family protein, partial [Polyangiaceae bacterium]|nr:CDP-glycerol glycerophosphotransferase family protein [Polyangiaceae bacterium]
DGSWKHPGRYGDVLELGYADLLETGVRERGHAPVWVQRMVLYEYTWHVRLLLRNPAAVSFLDEAQVARYKSLLLQTFESIDADTIIDFELAGCWLFHKIGILGLFKQTAPPFQHVYVESYDARKRLLQLRYFFHGEAPLESFSLDGVDVLPACAKTRRHDFLGETFVDERILWLPVGDPSAHFSAQIGTQETRISSGGKIHAEGLPLSVALARFAPKPPRSAGLPMVVRLDRALAQTRLVRARFAHAWLFMDRDTQADDNAEHLYRYVRANHPEVNAWFLLRRSSPDWARLSLEGFRLIPFGSLAHRMALLNADHLISSHADHYVLSYLEKKWYGDFLRHRTTFLQ